MIYLDNAATTEPKYNSYGLKELNIWGNSHSKHFFGQQANQQLHTLSLKIKNFLGVTEGSVIFTSGATECAEILSRCTEYPIIASAYEHDCVYKSASSVFKNIQELEEHLSSLKPGFPRFVFWQLCNNITGNTFPIEKIGEVVHKYGNYLIVDATAAIGHIKLNPNIGQYCDCIFASGHKFHANKGIGFMWMNNKFRISCTFNEDSANENNQYNLKQGTVDVSAAFNLVTALINQGQGRKLIRNLDTFEVLYIELLKILDELKVKYSEITIPSLDVSNLYFQSNFAIVCLRINGVNAEALCNYLSSKDICISTANSACAEEGDYRVVKAMGHTEEEAKEMIRVSFCEDNTIEEVMTLAQEIKEFQKQYVGV